MCTGRPAWPLTGSTTSAKRVGRWVEAERGVLGAEMTEADNPYAAPQTTDHEHASAPWNAYRRACTAGFTCFQVVFGLTIGASSFAWYCLTGIAGEPTF